MLVVFGEIHICFINLSVWLAKLLLWRATSVDAVLVIVIVLPHTLRAVVTFTLTVVLNVPNQVANLKLNFKMFVICKAAHNLPVEN